MTHARAIADALNIDYIYPDDQVKLEIGSGIIGTYQTFEE